MASLIYTQSIKTLSLDLFMALSMYTPAQIYRTLFIVKSDLLWGDQMVTLNINCLLTPQIPKPVMVSCLLQNMGKHLKDWVYSHFFYGMDHDLKKNCLFDFSTKEICIYFFFTLLSIFFFFQLREHPKVISDKGKI